MDNNFINKRSSSCYFLDIRNSTKIIRTISLKNNRASDSRLLNTTDQNKILHHAEFMFDVHKFLFKKLVTLKIDDYYFNNTGDGHVCLVWNETHAWTILDIACSISIYLEKRMKEYRTQHLKSWAQEYKTDLSIGFGIGMHTGRSIISKEKKNNPKFAYGIVLNTAARTESFTKNFPKIDLLFTNYFKERLENQFRLLKSPTKTSWAEYNKIINPVTNFHVDTKDSKSRGHLLHTIEKENLKYFITV